MPDRRAVAGEQAQRTAKTVRAIVQCRCASPDVLSARIEIGNQPGGVAGIGSRGQALQQLADGRFFMLRKSSCMKIVDCAAVSTWLLRRLLAPGLRVWQVSPS